MRRALILALSLVLSSCTAPEAQDSATTFDEGWAISFLSGDLLAVTERGGAVKLRDQSTGAVTELSGVPEVVHQGQGGMHDLIPGPDGTVYLSWVRPHEQGAQGVVGRANLNLEENALENLEVIWEQTPAAGNGHFSLRLLIQDGHLFVTSGDRQLGAPAQDHGNNLGSVLRLTLDGDPAPGNPWGDERWTMGNRNILGIDADAAGRIWITEMGPRGGDELNLVLAGENYGWPEASMGSHYDGTPIPDHTAGDGFRAPEVFWNPSISPGNLLIRADGDALIGGLSGERIVRVSLGEPAEILEEWDTGERIRALAEAPDGSVWVLEDGSGGRLYQWRP